MSNSNKDTTKEKVAKPAAEPVKVRSLTELRQDTTEKSQKALESRIAYFESKRENKLQQGVESVVGKIVGVVADLSQNIRKLIPEDSYVKLTEFWNKLILAF